MCVWVRVCVCVILEMSLYIFDLCYLFIVTMKQALQKKKLQDQDLNRPVL